MPVLLTLILPLTILVRVGCAQGITYTSHSPGLYGTVVPYATPYPLLYVNGGLVDCDNVETLAVSTWSARIIETTATPYTAYTTEVFTSVTTTTVPIIETSYTPTLRLDLLPGDIEICDYKNSYPTPFDAQSNGLEGICQLVAEMPRCFISLRPTPAAHMPTWVGYLVQFLVGLFGIRQLTRGSKKTDDTTDGSSESPRRGWAFSFKVVGALVTVFRTAFALYLVLEYRHSLDKLPFISPVLWADWAGVHDLLDFSVHLSFISTAIGVAIYVVCFWLCLGYGSLAYGVYQYDVLDVPSPCLEIGAGFEDTQISFQTDPRRNRFVILHTVIFSFASLGMLVSFVFWRSRPKAYRVDLFLSAFILLPVLVGIIVAAVVNGHQYLILNPRRYCFASYVSGRLGYLDLDWVTWKIKLATLLGLSN